MAKKIIHPGVTKYRGHCGDCGCDFTYEREDVNVNFARGGENVSCPSCGHSCQHLGENGTRWPEPKPWGRGRLSCAS